MDEGKLAVDGRRSENLICDSTGRCAQGRVAQRGGRGAPSANELAEVDEAVWRIACVRSRQEHRFAELMAGAGFEAFLPCERVHRVYPNRTRREFLWETGCGFGAAISHSRCLRQPAQKRSIVARACPSVICWVMRYMPLCRPSVSS